MAARGGARPGAGRKPGSVNKSTADIKALAQDYGAEALETLAKLMRGTKTPAAARVAAAKELIDRGYGKATQAVELTGKDAGPVETITRVELVPLKK